MVTAIKDRQSLAAVAAPVRTKTPWRVAIDRIIKQTGCTWQQAQRTMDLINKMVQDGRSNNGVAYPTTKQMRSLSYRIFAQVIPHGQTVAPTGSAHEAIAAAVLDPADGELSLLHSRREIGGDRYCTVETRVDVFTA